LDADREVDDDQEAELLGWVAPCEYERGAYAAARDAFQRLAAARRAGLRRW
jgi:hypothetical protein